MVTRRKFLSGMAATSATLALAGCGSLLQGSAPDSDTIVFGMAGPLTGDNAEYGVIWRKSFNIALDEINGTGGIKGRKVEVVYEDTQADPKQAIAVAQKFVNDKRILAELGDFASPASMASSPIYVRGKLVQFGITNSHPRFTLGGEYMFSNSLTQEVTAKFLAETVVNQLKAKKQSVLYLDTDWGHVTSGIYIEDAKKLGAEIVFSGSYLNTEKDFRSLLVKARDAKPEALVLISYYNDAALIVQQARSVGVQARLVTAGSAYSARFISLGGDATNDVVMTTGFFPTDPRPEVQSFVKEYQKRYNETPDSFAAGAYDALKALIWAVEQGGADRVGIQQALKTGKNIPSIVYGPFQFDKDRRVQDAKQYVIRVNKGQYELYDQQEG